MNTDFTDLVDLAAAGLGGAAILCNDDFFAAKDNLLLPHAAEWREHEYTDRGKWMDGWESRRRREPGYDWCVIRLGLPGVIRGVVVDTAYFRGNFPEACSIEACSISEPLDLRALATAEWREILLRSPLKGDSKNLFPIGDPGRYTHLRLNIFPDGGVARLRVHGEVVPDWARQATLGGPVDLAAMENGAQVMVCSDMFFGSRHNLIKPGRPINMSDGWETKRRRGPGHDWSIVRLGARGVIRRAEIDTTHFKGNAPGRATLEGCDLPDATVGALTIAGAPWRPLLDTDTQPHTRHLFDDGLRKIGPVTHVRLSVFPDGGVARLRLWGEPRLVTSSDAGIARINAMEPEDASAGFLAACGSRRWAEGMTAARPFEDLSALERAAERLWWQASDADWLEAFAAHPEIGARASQNHGGAQGQKWAEGEQAAARHADEVTLAELAEVNREYREKMGFIYIVCATGKSAAEMLGLARERLRLSPDQERRHAAEEQAKITQLRLRKWVTAP